MVHLHQKLLPYKVSWIVVMKSRYTSSPVSIINCLQKSHKVIFNKLSEWERHPLHNSVPRINPATLKLRQVKPTLPICNTECLKKSFINGLSFNYNLAISKRKYLLGIIHV